MKEIPTLNEPEKLRQAYKERYGEAREEYQKDMLEWMEFELLNEEYKKRFGDCIGTMMVSVCSEINQKIRKSLETGKPYEYEAPEGAIY